VAATLDLIESLKPRTVIPGHGGAFTDVPLALARARKRLDGFVNHPAKHIHYAAKVMLKFKLLELQAIELEQLVAWARAADLLLHLHQADAPHLAFEVWVAHLADELVANGAAARHGSVMLN
jgi:hypothetical protein